MAKGQKPIHDPMNGKADPYPAAKSNSTGSRGGFPGYKGGNGGTSKSAAGLHKGGGESGHVAAHTKRASTTGYKGIKGC
jgi:hypothetical protein